MNHFLRLSILLLVWLAVPREAAAIVVDSTDNGFTVRHEILIGCHPDSIFRYLTRDVSKWWDPAHTWSGKAENLVIQTKANGCFCEKLENGGSVKHMSVVFVEPGKLLRLQGGLGPLQMLAVVGTLTFEIIPSVPAPRVSVIYTVGGYSPSGLKHIAPVVDQVLGDQVKRLKDYAEGITGK